MKAILQTTSQVNTSFFVLARRINRVTTLNASESCITAKELLFTMWVRDEEILFQGKSIPQSAPVELRSSFNFEQAKTEFVEVGLDLLPVDGAKG